MVNGVVDPNFILLFIGDADPVEGIKLVGVPIIDKVSCLASAVDGGTKFIVGLNPIKPLPATRLIYNPTYIL